MTQAYPLAWPDGWKRTSRSSRKNGSFGVTERKYSGDNSWNTKKRINVADASKRIHAELEKLGVKNPRDDSIISTNLKLNMSGLPRGDQGEPSDPGAAVYWQKPGQPMRVMAVDAYSRVADNLAAIAATLNAMRAIERHGGAQILERAFTGFDALPPPGQALRPPRAWWEVLGVAQSADGATINSAYREKAKAAHPDAGGSDTAMAELNAARVAGLQARGRP